MEGKSTVGGAPAALGNKRWLYTAFLVGGALAAYVVGQILGGVWEMFAAPNDLLVIGIAVLVGFGGAVVAYRNPAVSELATEVIGELAKVTWPTRKETTAATLVVIVVSVVASIVLGLYDAFWSWLTDLIYVT